MESNGVRLSDNLLFPEDPSRPDLDALRIAKAKQDLSHRKLDRWIAAAIAELSETAARDQSSAAAAAKTRSGDTGKPAGRAAPSRQTRHDDGLKRSPASRR